MPPVRRHRIGDQLPEVIHPDSDSAALALCRDLASETDVEAVILLWVRGGGHRAHRRRTGHVAGPGNRSGCAVGKDPPAQWL